MADAAPLFYAQTRGYIDLVLILVIVVIEVVALLHCLIQRSEAFPAIGTLPKGAWLALTGGSLLLTMLLGWGGISLFAFIGITIAAIYLLDVRPALRDAVDGHGPW